MSYTKLVLTAFLCLSLSFIKAQCPGCVPVDCSAQLPDGGICDTALPDGMVNLAYDEKVSFYMPTTVVDPGTGFTVELRRIKITGITGLPIGIDWESDKSGSNDTYRPTNGDNFGCVRFCGTSIQAGTFNITVYLSADVFVPAISQSVNNQPQTYQTRVRFLPDTTGAGGPATFEIQPAIYTSCDSLDLGFTGLIDGAPNPTDYYWDFTGSGSASGVLGSRNEQYLFSSPGTHTVKLNTVINNFVLDVVQVQNVNGNYAGDIEEATTVQSPDLYFTIPSLGYRSSSGSDSRSETWTGLGIVVPQGSSTLTIEIWDEDTGPPLGSNDDFLGEAVINLAQLGTNFWYDANGTSTNGLTQVTITPGTVISDSFDLYIDSVPPVPPIIATKDTFCGGDSSVLSAAIPPGYFIKWYKDSIEIPLETDSTLVVYDEGLYSLEIVSTYGCNRFVDTAKFIKKFPSPPGTVTLIQQGDQLIVSNYNNSFDVRWYLDGVAIPGVDGQFLDLNQTGTYRAEMYNAFCSSFSSPFNVTSTGIGLPNEELVKIIGFPNPTNGEITFNWDQPVGDGARYSVYSLLGQEVLSGLDLQAGQQSLSLRTSNWENGVYLLVIIREGERMGYYRFIKH